MKDSSVASITYVFERVISIGFGRKNNWVNPTWRLFEVVGKYNSRDECQEAYQFIPLPAQGVACFKKVLKGPCDGDQGGPVCDKMQDVAIGTLSHGVECGGLNGAKGRYPTIYATTAGHVRTFSVNIFLFIIHVSIRSL